MAETIKKVVEVEIDVDSGDIKKVGTEVEGISKNLKKADKGTKGLAGGFKKVGTAIKAAGIGLLIAALGTLVEVFKSNQGAIDGFETALISIKIAFNDLFKFVENNADDLVSYFESIFNDPQQSMKDFGDAIQENLIERFNSYLDTLGFVASAIKNLFKGDFDAAMDDVKKAGKEVIDVYTGVNNSFDKGTEIVNNAAEAIAEYTSETLKSAEATVKLSKAAEIAAIKQQGLIEEFDRAAEIQRQIRDDDTKSFADRIAANEKLGEILQDQIKAETDLINIQTSAIQDKRTKGLIPEFEAQKQLLQLQNEKKAILAKVTGFESEQLINKISLQREEAELQKSLNDAEKERVKGLITQQNLLDSIRLDIMQDGIDKELMASAIKYDALYAQAEGNAKLQNEITESQELASLEIQKKYIAQSKILADQAEAEKIQLAENGINAAISLTDSFVTSSEKGAKRQFQIAKALQLSLAIVDGFKAANASLASSPIAIGPAPNPAGIASLAFSIAASAANVAKIAATQYQGGETGGNNSPPSLSSGGMSGAGGGAPQFNTVGTSGFNQISESIANKNNQPVKAFVVASDVSTAQALDRNKVQQASFP